ncbi:MAG: hypothetical protein ACOYKE_13875, partial [Ferruginibacter sp.]
MKNILLLLLLFPSLLFAQKISIQLIDETSKQAIEGTTVFTSKGYATQSDKDGFFTVKMSQGDTLFFTRIGYRNAQFIFNDAQ